MANKKNNFYLTREQLIKEIVASKKKYRESNYKVTPAECFTTKLTEYLCLIVKNYANKGQWRGYSYIEDMKSEALLTLCQNAFKYDETRYDNPFGYYTQIIKYCFITSLEKEEKVRDTKDSLWESIGMTPSYSRQIENEMMKHVSDTNKNVSSNKGIKSIKKDIETLNLKIEKLSSIISRINKIKIPDMELNSEISEVLDIEIKNYTGDFNDVYELFENRPYYKIEKDIVISDSLVQCLTVDDNRTKSNIKRIIPDTSNQTIILSLCSIALTLQRDLMIKRIREISGANIISTKVPTSDKIDGESLDSEDILENFSSDEIFGKTKKIRKKLKV
jgi:hypothetical protein